MLGISGAGLCCPTPSPLSWKCTSHFPQTPTGPWKVLEVRMTRSSLPLIDQVPRNVQFSHPGWEPRGRKGLVHLPEPQDWIPYHIWAPGLLSWPVPEMESPVQGSQTAGSRRHGLQAAAVWASSKLHCPSKFSELFHFLRKGKEVQSSHPRATAGPRSESARLSLTPESQAQSLGLYQVA